MIKIKTAHLHLSKRERKAKIDVWWAVRLLDKAIGHLEGVEIEIVNGGLDSQPSLGFSDPKPMQIAVAICGDYFFVELQGETCFRFIATL